MSQGKAKGKSWSERQQVVAIILIAGLVIGVLWFFLLLPLNRRRAKLEHEIVDMQEQLARRNYLLDEESLRRRRDAEEANVTRALNQWDQLKDRTTIFTNTLEVSGDGIGNIDFKVALFEVRQALQKKSRAMQLTLPQDLGMDDAVHSNEDARKLMLQLRSIEKVVDLALDLKTGNLKKIVPQEPVIHMFGPDEEAYMEEYPVTVEFHGTLASLYGFLNAAFRPGTVFTLRKFRVETLDPETKMLDARLEMSGILFSKNPKALGAAPEQKPRRTGPLGH